VTEAGERASPDHLVVGHITKAHGTRGELFVWPLTDRPRVIFAPGRELLLGDEEGALDEDAPSAT
jgi:ribosomal 30S subunit maturation factor RimM